MTLLLHPFLIFLPGFFIAFHLLHFASCLILGFCLLAHLFCCGPAFFSLSYHLPFFRCISFVSFVEINYMILLLANSTILPISSQCCLAIFSFLRFPISALMLMNPVEMIFVRNQSPLCDNVCCVTKFYLIFGFLCACHLIYISTTLSMFVAPLLNAPDLPNKTMPLGPQGGNYVSMLAGYPV